MQIKGLVRRISLLLSSVFLATLMTGFFHGPPEIKVKSLKQIAGTYKGSFTTTKGRVIEGITLVINAAEAGNNATVGPTLIPLLAFGIPGSSSAALIGGALMLHGATPSPRMFELYPSVVYSLFIILFIGNFFNLAIGRFFALIYARLGQLPRHFVIPLITMMAVIGSYSFQGNPYDVVVMLVFGFIGFGMRTFGIPDAPLVITFLITPMMEGSLRRALLINQSDWFLALFKSPLAISLFVAGVVLTYLSIRLQVMERISGSAQDMDEEQQEQEAQEAP